MKRTNALFLLLIFVFFSVIPAFAQETYQYEYKDDGSTPLSTGIEEDKIYLLPKSTFKLELESDLDINETKENEEIFFILVNPVKASNGMYLPEDTRFSGYFKKIKKSSPLYKRARGYIIVDKILMPNEKTYSVRMEPKNGSDLKAPQILNVIRAVPAGIGAITFSVISVAAVAIESVTVVGLVVVPRTCKGFGLLISSMSKGLNYKAKAGSKMLFKLDTPVYVRFDDLKY